MQCFFRLELLTTYSHLNFSSETRLSAFLKTDLISTPVFRNWLIGENLWIFYFLSTEIANIMISPTNYLTLETSDLYSDQPYMQTSCWFYNGKERKKMETIGEIQIKVYMFIPFLTMISEKLTQLIIPRNLYLSF